MFLYRLVYSCTIGALAFLVVHAWGQGWLKTGLAIILLVRITNLHHRWTLARNRAYRLLLKSLSAKQRFCLTYLGRFWVRSSDGGTVTVRNPLNICYRRNILGGNRRFGIHLSGKNWISSGIPHFDHLLAQKLLVETDMPKLERTACFEYRWHI